MSKITDEEMEHLKHLPSLNYLDKIDNNSIKQCINLKELNDDELNYLSSAMEHDWQKLSPIERRNENIKFALCNSYSIYYPFVVKNENNILGTFTLKEKNMSNLGIITPDNTIWLMDLFVIPNYRYRGVGSYMVDSSILEAKRKGYKNMYLQCNSKLESYFIEYGFKTEYKTGSSHGMEMIFTMFQTL